MCQNEDGQWQGLKRLGELLMQVRGELARSGRETRETDGPVPLAP